ncbi:MULTISPECIES: TetR/AcrR family transcriptional regulator [Leeia]|uniref:TetR/AcrR family transcriptional regulator n=1 Tax=Leeia aquatica TaxID=2725557 RepID=A0A847SG01_9NEIS|nr:TetR/AcrR family transcriptional regulator [Leeia aquatica]NLR76346.1 TetR/AcrR family transcriptional regulator [Leeia aquatica]
MAKVKTHEEANRRTDLVRAAARLFREKGFERTTVRDIANAVGMQSGSIFYYFKSKEEILLVVMEEGLLLALQDQETALQGVNTAREKLRALMRAHLKTLLERGSDFIPVLLYEWKSLSEESQARIVNLRDRYEQSWNETLQALKDEGAIPTSVRITRLFVFGALNWTAQWYDPNLRLDIDGVADRALELFVR